MPVVHNVHHPDDDHESRRRTMTRDSALPPGPVDSEGRGV
jgi:hypothetical protein